jgi:putative ABC transport system permease protein
MSISESVVAVARAVLHARRRTATIAISLTASTLLMVCLSGFSGGLQSFLAKTNELLNTPVMVTSTVPPTAGADGQRGLGTPELDALSNGLDGSIVADVVPIKSGSGVMRNQGRTHIVTLYGTTPAYLDAFMLDVVAGTVFSNEQYNDGDRVALIGTALVDSLFAGDGSAALGSNVKLGRQTFRIIGLLGPDGKGSSSGATVLVPLTALREYLIGERLRDLSAIALVPAKPDQAVPIVRRATEILDSLHSIKNADQRDFTVSYVPVIPTIYEVGSVVVFTCISLIGFILFVAALERLWKRILVGRGRSAQVIGNRQQGENKRLVCARLLMESIAASALGGVVGVMLGVATSIIHRYTLPPINSLYGGLHISFYVIVISFTAALSIGLLTGLCGIFEIAFKAKNTLKPTPVQMVKSGTAALGESATSTEVAYRAARRDLA